MSSGITIPGRKGFQKSSRLECVCAGPDYHPDKPCPAHPKHKDEARRAQRRQAARTTRQKTHAVILRFPHEVHADLERVAGAAGEHVGTWIRRRILEILEKGSAT